MEVETTDDVQECDETSKLLLDSGNHTQAAEKITPEQNSLIHHLREGYNMRN